METLDKLFGSAGFVKIMKLFLFNTDQVFEKSEVQRRTKTSSHIINRELKTLEEISFIQKKTFYKEGRKLKNGKYGKKKRIQGYTLNRGFQYIVPLQKILIESSPIVHKDLLKRLQKSGKIKHVTVAGVFIQNDDSRIDLLVVGDSIQANKIKSTISLMESEIGRQLRYSVLDTTDFKYRMGICDRLVRDIFDFPHKVLIDKIGV